MTGPTFSRVAVQLLFLAFSALMYHEAGWIICPVAFSILALLISEDLAYLIFGSAVGPIGSLWLDLAPENIWMATIVLLFGLFILSLPCILLITPKIQEPPPQELSPPPPKATSCHKIYDPLDAPATRFFGPGHVYFDPKSSAGYQTSYQSTSYGNRSTAYSLPSRDFGLLKSCGPREAAYARSHVYAAPMTQRPDPGIEFYLEMKAKAAQSLLAKEEEQSHQFSPDPNIGVTYLPMLRGMGGKPGAVGTFHPLMQPAPKPSSQPGPGGVGSGAFWPSYPTHLGSGNGPQSAAPPSGHGSPSPFCPVSNPGAQQGPQSAPGPSQGGAPFTPAPGPQTSSGPGPQLPAAPGTGPLAGPPSVGSAGGPVAAAAPEPAKQTGPTQQLAVPTLFKAKRVGKNGEAVAKRLAILLEIAFKLEQAIANAGIWDSLVDATEVESQITFILRAWDSLTKSDPKDLMRRNYSLLYLRLAALQSRLLAEKWVPNTSSVYRTWVSVVHQLADLSQKSLNLACETGTYYDPDFRGDANPLLWIKTTKDLSSRRPALVECVQTLCGVLPVNNDQSKAPAKVPSVDGLIPLEHPADQVRHAAFRIRHLMEAARYWASVAGGESRKPFLEKVRPHIADWFAGLKEVWDVALKEQKLDDAFKAQLKNLEGRLTTLDDVFEKDDNVVTAHHMSLLDQHKNEGLGRQAWET